jgi:hypothetical protein
MQKDAVLQYFMVPSDIHPSFVVLWRFKTHIAKIQEQRNNGVRTIKLI